ncbi:ACT domain-containing protein [Jannaschia sp. Os4]|uniref:ACT domain-containing protein n=1 Tax=Jannaschia sp. Os4 TaxID=2807617 RepID=UPI00193AC096|nr:ACT domain-containing protein [Jannaschia sp. Os4]MBM2577458.1 ACT domain-containing protein [Jannaschia sp. Os4]
MTVSGTSEMIAGMSPRLRDGAWVFSGDAARHGEAIATIAEDAPSLIVPARDGEGPRMAWITLDVFSDLEGVGLTAAVSTALANAGIACNVVAGRSHDHLFVPEARAAEAMDILRARAMQETGAER